MGGRALNILKYAHMNGCELDEKVCSHAFLHNNIECLRYACKNGCHWVNSPLDNNFDIRKADSFHIEFSY